MSSWSATCAAERQFAWPLFFDDHMFDASRRSAIRELREP
jgi:hypothetical protein